MVRRMQSSPCALETGERRPSRAVVAPAAAAAHASSASAAEEGSQLLVGEHCGGGFVEAGAHLRIGVGVLDAAAVPAAMASAAAVSHKQVLQGLPLLRSAKIDAIQRVREVGGVVVGAAKGHLEAGAAADLPLLARRWSAAAASGRTGVAPHTTVHAA